MSPSPSPAPSDDTPATPASSAPNPHGLLTGIVEALVNDPGAEFRVRVHLPSLGDDGDARVWARLATFYASNGSGACFYPEPGDEVVVGFLNADPGLPVVLGSVYGKARAPAEPPTETNDVKALVTRGGQRLAFDDRDGVLEIRTSGHFVRLDEKRGEVRIEDENRNRVTLSSRGIALESASHVTISAKGNVTVDAGGNLALHAVGNVSVEGLQVAAKGKAKLTASSGAETQVTSSGIVEVRGTLVKIN
jgi:uncharacterized protein involved in type VI secretion and phage assembly